MKKKHTHRTKLNKLRQLLTPKRLVQTEPDQGQAQQDDGRTDSEQSPAVPESVVKPIQPAINEPKAEQPYPAARQQVQPAEPDRSTRRLQAWLPLIISFLTLVVITIHAYYYNKQWQAMVRQSEIMNRQSEVMSKQLDAMNGSSMQTQELIDQNRELVGHAGEQAKASLAQAEAAKQSVGAAQASARAAEKGAQIAKESFYIGDRPYVNVKKANMDKFEVGEKPRVYIHLINTGKTPALEVKVTAIINIGTEPKPDIKRPDLNDPDYYLYPSLAAGGDTGATLLASAETGVVALGAKPLSKLTIEEIKSGRLFIYVWGGGLYKDGLGKQHSFTFCAFYSPEEESFTACPTFNETK